MDGQILGLVLAYLAANVVVIGIGVWWKNRQKKP